jgi:hypothetical protein
VTAQSIIAVLGILDPILLALVAWLVRRLSTVAGDIAKVLTEVALLRREVTPEGSKSLAERVSDCERSIAVLTATIQGRNQAS